MSGGADGRGGPGAQLGFEVVDVEDGRQCINVLRQRHKDVCCVFMDLVMPHMVRAPRPVADLHACRLPHDLPYG